MCTPANLRVMIILCVITVVGGVTAQNAPPAKPKLTGPWSGAIQIPNSPLRVIVRFSGAADSLKGTIDIPQQAAQGLPLEVSLNEGRLRFKIVGAPGDPLFD